MDIMDLTLTFFLIFSAALQYCEGDLVFDDNVFQLSPVNGKYYFMSANAMNFDNSRNDCIARNSMLAEFRTEQDWNAIMTATGNNKTFHNVL